jgi:hypothetical protein
MNHSIAGLEVGDVAADLDDLPGPLVARDDRVVERDDVTPFEQLEVRVADADRPRGHEHLVRLDGRGVDLRERQLVDVLELNGLHRVLTSG